MIEATASIVFNGYGGLTLGYPTCVPEGTALFDDSVSESYCSATTYECILPDSAEYQGVGLLEPVLTIPNNITCDGVMRTLMGSYDIVTAQKVYGGPGNVPPDWYVSIDSATVHFDLFSPSETCSHCSNVRSTRRYCNRVWEESFPAAIAEGRCIGWTVRTLTDVP